MQVAKASRAGSTLPWPITALIPMTNRCQVESQAGPLVRLNLHHYCSQRSSHSQSQEMS